MTLRIKAILREKNLTSVWLASQVGITQPNMSNIVSGKNNPSLETLEKIASALVINISELFDAPPSGQIACPNCGASIKLSVSKE